MANLAQYAVYFHAVITSKSKHRFWHFYGCCNDGDKKKYSFTRSDVKWSHLFPEILIFKCLFCWFWLFCVNMCVSVCVFVDKTGLRVFVLVVLFCFFVLFFFFALFFCFFFVCLLFFYLHVSLE